MNKDMSDIAGTVENSDAIKNSITNVILTPKGSVPGKPNFGSDVCKVVFSQLDSLRISMLKNYIREALYEFEPRISINEIKVKSIEEYNKIVVNVYYEYKNIHGINDESVGIVINV